MIRSLSTQPTITATNSNTTTTPTTIPGSASGSKTGVLVPAHQPPTGLQSLKLRCCRSLRGTGLGALISMTNLDLSWWLFARATCVCG